MQVSTTLAGSFHWWWDRLVLGCRPMTTSVMDSASPCGVGTSLGERQGCWRSAARSKPSRPISFFSYMSSECVLVCYLVLFCLLLILHPLSLLFPFSRKYVPVSVFYAVVFTIMNIRLCVILSIF